MECVEINSYDPYATETMIEKEDKINKKSVLNFHSAGSPSNTCFSQSNYITPHNHATQLATDTFFLRNSFCNSDAYRVKSVLCITLLIFEACNFIMEFHQ
jgi:hypothetical protein